MLGPFPPSLRVGSPTIYHCEPAWSWSPPPFADFDVWIITAGRGSLEHNGNTYPLRAGSSFLFQPGDRIRATHDPKQPLTVFACHFLCGSGRLGKDLIHVTLDDIRMVRESGETAARVFTQGREGEAYAASLVTTLVTQLLFERRAGASRSRTDLAALGVEIRSKPSDPWTLSLMARRCSLSVPHFKRRFREEFGMPPLQYVLHQRAHRATQLLRETTLTIQQIAAAVGCEEVTYFHRQFKRLTGRTPREVRLHARPS